MKNITDYLKVFKNINKGPRIKVAELTNMNTPDLEQSPDSFLRPGETLEDWDVSFRRPNAQGGRIGFGDGQLVAPSVDGLRPGYGGVVGAGLSLDRLSEYKSAEEFYNKSIKNHKYLDKNKKYKNPYYKKNWDKLKAWQRTSITDNIYKTSLTIDKVPPGYEPVKQWAVENKIPSFEKTNKSGTIDKIDRISAALSRGDDRKYRSDINYIKENLKPIKLRTSGGNVPGLGVGNIQDRWYIKVDKNSKKNLLDFFDQRYLHSSTMNNINTFLKDDELVKLIKKGNYEGIVARMTDLPGSDTIKSNALARIAQMMSGVKFRAFDPGIEVNKVNANRIFKGLSETRWGNPFFPAFRRLVMDTIQKEIGGDYFNKKYSTFVTDARKILTKQFGKEFMKTMDINEITGMTSGFRGGTFNSTQFINLADSNFNQVQHANMLRWYGEAETKVANALKNNNRYKANQIIKKWDTWAQNWYKELPSEYKTKAVKDTIPTFKVGVDPVKNIFSPERLAEMKKVHFDPRGDYIANQKLQLAKTFKTHADTPLLAEVTAGDKKAMARLKAQIIKYKEPLKIKLNSGLPVEDILKMIHADLGKVGLSVPMEQIKNVAGKTLSVLGKVAVVADPVFMAFDEKRATDRGAGALDTTEYVVDSFFQGLFNLPDLVASGVKWGKGKLSGEDTKFETGVLYEPFTFAEKELEKNLSETPMKKRVRNLMGHFAGAGGYKESKFEDPEYIKIFESLSDEELKKILEKGDKEHKHFLKEKPFEMDINLPMNLAGGGRAGLSGSSTSGRPPESGPQSGGLPSLYNNVRKW